MNFEVDYGPKAENAEIVSLDTAKHNSNIFHNEDDSLFEVIQSAIEDQIEAYLGYPVVRREEVKIRAEWHSSLSLPVKIEAITSINYKDADGVDQSLAAKDYEFFGGVLNINLDKPSYSDKYITIVGTAGYTNEKMPGWAKDAALLMFTRRDTYREDRKDINDTVAKSILRHHRSY